MSQSILSDNDILFIFASAPAGLGHLRVTKALSGGLPEDVTPILLGAHDPTLTFSHRIMSIHPILRSIMEWGQNGKQEDIFTKIYRKILRSQTNELFSQTKELVSQRITIPKTICIIATHFGLAHQYTVIKKQLEETTGARVYLFVQVTDDSPQHMWFVPGADMTFVPSHRTQWELEQYGKSAGFPAMKFHVSPYPVSPLLTRKNPLFFEHKEKQVRPNSSSTCHIAVPISGAAVGLVYTDTIIRLLHGSNGNCSFHIVANTTPFTSLFLSKMEHTPHVHVYSSNHNRQTVEAYEELYERIPVALEITKPSEQAFKALITPDRIGGPILLFTTPVGRQEWDNIEFLTRHELLPAKSQQDILYHAAKNTEASVPIDPVTISHWRSLRLPDDPTFSAAFILWLKKSGILQTMMHYTDHAETPFADEEVSPYGVALFWKTVEDFLETKTKK